MGSNLAEPATQLRRAFDELAMLPATTLSGRSALYGNPPMGAITQPDFVNAVAALDTSLSPHDLLDQLQAIERAHGRVRSGERWGPRSLDLDILLYGEECVDDERLQVPHPGIGERAFVLLPLAEIAPPALAVPGHAPLEVLFAACDTSAMRKLEPVA